MKTPKQKRRPGRPRNEEISQIESNLAVSRRRAAQLLKEAKDGSPEFSEKMKELRATILIQRGKLYEAQTEAHELKNAEMRGDFVSRREVFEKGAALAVAMRSVLSGWGATLAAQLAGQSELQIHEIMQGEIDNLSRLIRSSVQAFADEK